MTTFEALAAWTGFGQEDPEPAPSPANEPSSARSSTQGSPKNPMLRKSRLSQTHNFKDGSDPRRRSEPDTPPPTRTSIQGSIGGGSARGSRFREVPSIKGFPAGPLDNTAATAARSDTAAVAQNNNGVGSLLRGAVAAETDRGPSEQETPRRKLPAKLAEIVREQKAPTPRDDDTGGYLDGLFGGFSSPQNITGFWRAAAQREDAAGNEAVSIPDAAPAPSSGLLASLASNFGSTEVGVPASSSGLLTNPFSAWYSDTTPENVKAFQVGIANGADAASEYWMAHTEAVQQTFQLQHLEQVMARSGKEGLNNELIEAEVVANQAFQSASEAQELLRSAREQESQAVLRKCEVNDKYANRMDELSEQIQENYDNEKRALLEASEEMYEEEVTRHDVCLQENEQLMVAIDQARKEKETFAEEVLEAADLDIRARRLVKTNKAIHEQASELMRNEQGVANRTLNERQKASSQVEDIVASMEVNSYLVSALEADAEHSGKVADSEILEAQQMQVLVYAEMRQCGLLKDECDRLVREIRDLSRVDRAGT